MRLGGEGEGGRSGDGERGEVREVGSGGESEVERSLQSGGVLEGMLEPCRGLDLKEGDGEEVEKESAGASAL